jgi:hypothetical protein
MNLLRISNSLSRIISTVLVLPLSGLAQQPVTANPAQGGGGLKVVVIEGEGAVNRIKARTATQPVVEVRDESDKPVAGAEVIFYLPANGPGAVFYPYTHNQTVRTDAQGRAAATDMTPNDQEGRFFIRVTASSGAKTGTARITQNNSMTGGVQMSSGKSSRKTLYIILGVAAAGAIAGGVAASRSGSSSTTAVTNPVQISAGAITVGAPR